MKLTATIAASILAATALAAPAEVAEQSMMAASTSEWTIENMHRDCDRADTTCTYKFLINTKGPSSTDCEYVHAGAPATHTPGEPAECGEFTITSVWAGAFGPGEGFTTLSIVHRDAHQIIWASYTDVQLENGNVVKPNQAYAPVSLPAGTFAK